MRFTKQRVVLLLLVLFVAIISLMIAQKTESKDDFVVENFRVNDVPADDGTGLVLSWKPLHRSKRIIEYRVYRGISKDQLFFQGSIPVNVKTGVASDSMFFYDSSWTEFIDIKSPSKLRLERKQAEGSPLYRKIPRDVEVAASLSPKFTILSIIDKNNFYYKTKQSHSAEAADSTVYAGLELYKQTLLAKLKPGEEYFYTIVAVDEKENYHPYAPITSGIPLDNPPEVATDFYSVVIEDSLKMQFEWEYPLFNEDLYSWKVMMMPTIDQEEWNTRRIKQDFSGISMKPIATGQVSTVGSDAPQNYAVLDLKALMAEGISIEQIKASSFSLELMDYSQTFSYSKQSSPKIYTSAQLPPKPLFSVEDKPNDKGDRLTVVWDHPIVFVTQTSLEGKNGKKLRVNYQLNMTENQKVRNIYFKFFKPGESVAFATVNEFYQDDKVFITIPDDYNYRDGIRVQINLKTEPELKEDYTLEQDLVWEAQMLTIMPSKALYRNGIDVSTLGNAVYRKRTNTPFYTMIKRNTSFDNNMDITIPYESVVYKIVNGFNYIKGDSLISVTANGTFSEKLNSKMPASGVALVAADIDLKFDAENQRTIMTKIYSDAAVIETERKLKEANDKLKELEAEKAKFDSESISVANVGALGSRAEQMAQMQKQIEDAKKSISLLTNENLVAANAISSNRSRMRYIAGIRENDKRKQSYMVVRTNKKGLFVATDQVLDADGNHVYSLPVSNWFDRNKFVTLFAMLIFAISVISFVNLAKRGKSLYLRPIAGLSELDNAIGRATEMGRPMLYCLGAGGLSDPATLASLGILGFVAKKAAEYDTKMIVPCYDYMVMPIAQEIVRDAHYEVGRPDTYDKNNVFYLTNVQFAYVAGVNGIMVRERMATNFFLGMFYAEALLMTETGNFIGAVQVAGTDAITQIPFFITTCDYTLIGEELYAASAYLCREPMLLGTLKGQDYYKFLILSFILVGSVLATFQYTQITRLFPTK